LTRLAVPALADGRTTGAWYGAYFSRVKKFPKLEQMLNQNGGQSGRLEKGGAGPGPGGDHKAMEDRIKTVLGAFGRGGKATGAAKGKATGAAKGTGKANRSRTEKGKK
jgi:hypothetical protein